jgi:branched-chain amino acid transport system substrate-binding protein
MTLLQRPLLVLRAAILTALLGMGFAFGAAARSDQAPLIVGVPFSVAAQHYGRASQMLAGAKAYIDKVNAQGGIGGREVRLVTIKDEGKSDVYAQRLRSVIREQGAVALLGCTVDAVCIATAAIAAENAVPLIAPLSGAAALSRQKNPYVFRVRAGFEKEADAIAMQLSQLACEKIALVTEDKDETEGELMLRSAMEAKGAKVQVIRVDTSNVSDIKGLVQKLGAGGYHAAVMNLGLYGVGNIVNAGQADRPEWPRFLMTHANGNLTTLLPYFKDRVVGFSQVVPNPELLANPLARDLEQDADQFGSALAVTLNGMEGYLGARLLVDALRRSGPKPNSLRLAEVLANQDQWLISGFKLSFHNRETGSDWVDTGLRSRAGVLVR